LVTHFGPNPRLQAILPKAARGDEFSFDDESCKMILVMLSRISTRAVSRWVSNREEKRKWKFRPIQRKFNPANPP